MRQQLHLVLLAELLERRRNDAAGRQIDLDDARFHLRPVVDRAEIRLVDVRQPKLEHLPVAVEGRLQPVPQLL